MLDELNKKREKLIWKKKIGCVLVLQTTPKNDNLMFVRILVKKLDIYFHKHERSRFIRISVLFMTE